jgi:hypothetical protein
MTEPDTPDIEVDTIVDAHQVLRQHLERLRKGCSMMHEQLNTGGLSFTSAELAELHQTWLALKRANVPPSGKTKRSSIAASQVEPAVAPAPKLGSFIRQHLDTFG